MQLTEKQLCAFQTDICRAQHDRKMLELIDISSTHKKNRESHTLEIEPGISTFNNKYYNISSDLS